MEEIWRLKRRAEESARRSRELREGRLEAARERLTEADEAVRTTRRSRWNCRKPPSPLATTLVRAIAGIADLPGITVRPGAVLAALLLAEPPPQLMLLDEPADSLDMASVRQLTQALDGYRGALLMASHDVHFLRWARITRWLRLDRATGLREIDPL